jgi:lysophospholipase L1-like esterase
MRISSAAVLFLSFTLVGSCAIAVEAPDEPTPRKDKSGKPDERFLKRHEDFVAEANKGGTNLLLLGDFLTDDWRGNNKNKVKAIYDRAFGPYHPANFGQGGDYVQHLLWRVQNGELEGISPKVVMLLIGGTNGSNNDPPEKIADAVKAIIATVREKCPSARILLLSVPPRGESPTTIRTRHMSVNPYLAKLDDGGKTVQFVDLAAKYLQPDGTVSRDLMPDFFHLSEKGYQVWADTVAQPLKELIESKRD